MPASYSMSNSFVYSIDSPSNYSILHSCAMAPHELFKALVDGTKQPLRKVAAAMDRASFQASLYKYVHGHVATPTHSTAKKISDYFKLPIEAVYDPAVATRIAAELGIGTAKPMEAVAQVVKEPQAIPMVGKRSKARLSDATLARIEGLNSQQFNALDSMIQAYLDTVQPEARDSKAHQA